MARGAPAVVLLAAVATTSVLGAMLPPRLSSTQNNISLREGQTRFVLECNLDVGDDPISYRWLKNHQIVTGALGYAYRGYRKVFLALHTVEQQHAGTYVCEASNDAGVHSAAIKVTVDSWGSSVASDEKLPHTDETLSDIATSLSDVLAEGECNCHTLFLIHASTDSPPETISAQANLVHTIANQIISDTNRVSVMTYSDYTHTKLSFRNGSNKCALRDAFRDLSHDKWATRLEPVLREILKKFRKSKASCKILFLPIFGSLGTEGADIIGSQHLQKVGVKIFILEVTPTPLEGVREMASQRGDRHPYHWRVPLQIWPTIVVNMKYMAEEVEGCMSREEDVPGVCVGQGGSCTDDSMCRGIGFGCSNGQCVFKECNINPAQPGCCKEESRTRQFWCGDVTGQCTSANSMCNGRVQCMNGADEGTCWSVPCPKDKIARCQTSTLCLDLMDLCNGEPACPGEEDEDPRFCRSFPCPRDRPFRCRSGKCIAKESLCDGVFKDCAEGEDELLEFCKRVHVCPANRPFKCDYGICVPERVVCDGTYNCLDATDELVCELNNCPAERPFKCLNSLCISMDQVCNGVVDGCTDGSDEENCTQIECPPKRNFKCNSGRCIDGWLRCNNHDDCGDGTDELNCDPPTTTALPPPPSPRACSRHEFTCNNGSCIPDIRVCDGRNHCLNGEDELNCEDRPCPSNRPHRCKDGTCVVSAVPCNDIKECGDGSDEINCTHVEPEPEPEPEHETAHEDYVYEDDYSEEVTEEPAPRPRPTTPATTTTTTTTTTEKHKPKETIDMDTEVEEETLFEEHETAAEDDTHMEGNLEYDEDESDVVETMLEEAEPEEVRPAASSEQGVGGSSGTCVAPTCIMVAAPLLVITFRNVWTR